MAGRYTFADAKRWLRKHFPSRRRVRIRLADRAEIDSNTPDAVAVCLFRTRGLCEILIDKAASLDSKIEHLHEEWAHLLRWHLPLESGAAPDEHDDIYWLIYGRIKRAWNE